VLTGRIFNPNWPVAHLLPLASSQRCTEVVFVSVDPVPPIPKVKTIYPPRWLVRLIGGSPARLIIFALTVLWTRPDAVGGFHMKINALLAVTLAPLVGARALYFCVGGPVEVLDGGIYGEAKTFERMETPDAVVERRLLAAADSADLILTMGTGAMKFFRQRGLKTRIEVVAGGIDPEEYCPPSSDSPRPTDVVLVGRLVQVKRIDVFLDAMRIVADEMPHVQAAILGDGKRLHDQLHEQANRLALNDNVTFVGYTPDVAGWLRRSKVFALTSDSEGLSLALMQAMLCGLPAVVTDVGDLSDLVQEGANGHLVPRRSAEALARRIVSLLRDEERLTRFSAAAREAAMRFSTGRTIELWDRLLAELDGSPAVPRCGAA
jgi:glycosyltransferase involved in cell wall biosynthesis